MRKYFLRYYIIFFLNLIIKKEEIKAQIFPFFNSSLIFQTKMCFKSNNVVYEFFSDKLTFAQSINLMHQKNQEKLP